MRDLRVPQNSAILRVAMVAGLAAGGGTAINSEISANDQSNTIKIEQQFDQDVPEHTHEEEQRDPSA